MHLHQGPIYNRQQHLGMRNYGSGDPQQGRLAAAPDGCNGYLAHEVAGWEGHVWQGSGIPGAQDQAPVLWVGLDAGDDTGQLIHSLACVVCMHALVFCSKMPPLEPVHWPQVTLLPAGCRKFANSDSEIKCRGLWACDAP